MSFKQIPLGTPEIFNAVIEMTEDDRNKYEYDEKLDAIKLDFVFQGDFKHPFNYGFIPKTRAKDGDYLDVIVLSSSPIEVGTVVPARAVGMVELIDRGKEDHKIIAVTTVDAKYNHYQSIKNLSEKQVKQFENFFKEVAIQKNKVMEVKSFQDKNRALNELIQCKERYRKEEAL